MRYIILFFLLLNNCTTIGFHEDSKRKEMDFGSYKEIKICTIYEDPITVPEIEDLFLYWNEELSLYALKAISIEPTKIERPGFTGVDIIRYLLKLPLTNNCDRILYLKGRTWKDIAFEFFTLGLFVGVGLKVEVQGAVESSTSTRGYIKAKYISTLQLLFTSPKSTLVHEGYHLLGCGHQLFMEDCYRKIRATKLLSEDPNLEVDFFPSSTYSGDQFINREQVDQFLQIKN